MNHASASGNRSLHQAFRVIIVLVTLCIAEAFLLVWRWRRNPVEPVASFPDLVTPAHANPIREKFPEVDFSAVYPGLSRDRIDELQRDSVAVRFVYAPFVEFAPLPIATR